MIKRLRHVRMGEVLWMNGRRVVAVGGDPIFGCRLMDSATRVVTDHPWSSRVRGSGRLASRQGVNFALGRKP